MKKQRNMQNVKQELLSFFGGLKSVPVIVMLAMNPALLNSNVSAKGFTMVPEYPIVEVCMPASEVVEAPQQPQSGNFVRPETDHASPEIVQFSMDFKAEGKNWTMYYVDITKTSRSEKNVVSRVIFVPQDYKRRSSLGREETAPPGLVWLSYHDIGADEFIGVVVDEIIDKSGSLYRVRREIKLPDEVGNELMGLLLDETQFKPINILKGSTRVVNTPDLDKTVETKIIVR